MFGRKRKERDPDAEIHQPLTPEQRERAHEHALFKLRAAKAQYIAGRLSFDDLFEHWWRADLSLRPVFSMKFGLREIALEAMELEKAKYLDRPTQLVNQSLPTGTKEP